MFKYKLRRKHSHYIITYINNCISQIYNLKKNNHVIDYSFILNYFNISNLFNLIILAMHKSCLIIMYFLNTCLVHFVLSPGEGNVWPRRPMRLGVCNPWNQGL